jgi:uncharacterized protein YdbL (DUF1318 family)
MFHNVCGLALKNAVIVTTHWDVVGDEKAVELEQELLGQEKYFLPLCKLGAVPFGHNNTRASAVRIMNKVLNNTPIVLQIQEELTKPGITIGETAAGALLNMHEDAMKKRYEKEIEKLREEKKEALKAKDKAWQKELDDELDKQQKLVDRSKESKEHLKKSPYVPL